jgi:hypothetical protein
MTIFFEAGNQFKNLAARLFLLCVLCQLEKLNFPQLLLPVFCDNVHGHAKSPIPSNPAPFIFHSVSMQIMANNWPQTTDSSANTSTPKLLI